jgi:uncharacterized membrane protein
MHRLVFIAIVAASIGSGLIAGTFFIFSVAVMPAFRQLPAESAMSAMKRINLVIINPIFIGAFLGTAIVSLGLAVWSVFNLGGPGISYLLAGSMFYLIGSFGVTIALNVPLNNALAVTDDHSVCERFAQRWTVWNHIRAFASTVAAGLFTLAAASISQP